MDRNLTYQLWQFGRALSLSARRAWIEINGAETIAAKIGSRSPQGERG